MQRVKHSIKKQYALVFGVLLAAAICLFCLVNALVLNKVYVHHKMNALILAYDRINNAADDGTFESDDFKKEFNYIASMDNLDIIVLNSDMEVVLATSQDFKRLSGRLMDYIFGNQESLESVYDGHSYTIVKAKDSVINLEFIELWGVLSNGYVISMRSPLESIKDSAVVANELMVVIGAMAIVIGTLLVLVLSGRLTQPIMKLVKISERMTQLDFEVKYDSCGNNEIDLLGEHINQLSGALERTISDLKSANLELQRDIDAKNELEEKRKEFVANVSHELKTPIALIQGYAEGLKDCVNDDADSRDFYCEVIMDEADKMNKLVKNLLELNQLESGTDKALMERFDVVELIHNCAASMDILVKQNGVKLILPERTPVYIWADEFKTEQIVNNYLSNAIHYAEGEKIVRISVEEPGSDEKTARISVFNSGQPIDEEQISQIWNKFYKVDKARTRSYGGSGIGLSIVKAIMEQLGQNYGVINHHDGVEFYFEADASAI